MAKAIPAVWRECCSGSQMSYLIDNNRMDVYSWDISEIGDAEYGSEISCLGTDDIPSILDGLLTTPISIIGSEDEDNSRVSAIGDLPYN